jgi:hypothetical protein
MSIQSLPYMYDVFVSYRRHAEWPTWVQEHFKPIFEHYLGEHLGRAARIFIDTHIESGSQWPEVLALAHTRSAILVPLWSKTYFNSRWCQNELALMYAREKHCGYRTVSRPDVLILPASIHDGDDFPKYAQAIQWLRLNEYANVRLNRRGQSAEDLARLIDNWTRVIASAVKSAPRFCDPGWTELSISHLVALFESAPVRQIRVPVFGRR